LVQSLTKRGLNWDDQVSEEDKFCWLQWKQELPMLEKLKVARCVKPASFGQVVRVDLHHFCEASILAYGAVSYARLVNVHGQVHCSLLLAKARLAPINQVTIPRLELMSAVIAAKQDQYCRKQLGIDINSSTFWSDSQIVLSCIKNSSKRFPIFVASRLSAIWSMPTPEQWYHVRTDVNAADVASRGATVTELLGNRQWLSGPEFLWTEESVIEAKETSDCQLTVSSASAVLACNMLEANVSLPVAEFKPQAEESVLLPLVERVSSWMKMRGAVACVVKAMRLFKCKGNSPVTSPVGDCNRAEALIIAIAQKELKTMDGMKSIRDLDPFPNDKGLLCVGGRLRQSSLPDETKHQLILPAKQHITRVIIRHCHQFLAHAGLEHVLCKLREKYWIVRARREIKKVLKDCVTCKRNQGALGKQKMADLPAVRVTPCQPPFTDIGIDLFGPFEVKSGRSSVKRYGCIFTCLACRAIHIEVVFSLDVSSFLNALQRFSARRGWPSRIWSDNGTNFVAADRELQHAFVAWNKQHVEKHLQQHSIEWHFNPPHASHMGGAWERLIRSVRKTLMGLTTLQKLDDESLVTLLCSAEMIVNSRPLMLVTLV
jgi:hypothetical protein